MMWRWAVLLLLAAGVNAALAKPKPRDWQSGEVTEVAEPGAGRQPGWGTIGPHVNSGTQVIVPESSSFAARWVIAIALPDAIYVVTLPPPPRKSSLAKLEAGSKLGCAVEGKTMYLKDQKGAVFRASIRERSAP
ncbi:MAG: hypothetical protein HY822_19915 [Acidobacteria bacterium]|nr:hypothetical protein [Acidobacteriota bacterium]